MGVFLWGLISGWQLTGGLGPVTELLRGSRTPTAGRCLRGSCAHVWSKLGPICPSALSVPKTHVLCALLVAGGLLDSYMRFHRDWSYEPETMCPCLGMRAGFGGFCPINWSNVNIFG